MFEGNNLDHRTDVLPDAEGQGILAIDRRTGQCPVNRPPSKDEPDSTLTFMTPLFLLRDVLSGCESFFDYAVAAGRIFPSNRRELYDDRRARGSGPSPSAWPRRSLSLFSSASGSRRRVRSTTSSIRRSAPSPGSERRPAPTSVSTSTASASSPRPTARRSRLISTDSSSAFRGAVSLSRIGAGSASSSWPRVFRSSPPALTQSSDEERSPSSWSCSRPTALSCSSAASTEGRWPSPSCSAWR